MDTITTHAIAIAVGIVIGGLMAANNTDEAAQAKSIASRVWTWLKSLRNKK